MSRKVIFSQGQLDEIIGGNAGAYLDGETDSKVNANNETYAGTPTSKPMTMDRFAKQRTPDIGYWMPGGRSGHMGTIVHGGFGTLNCNTKTENNRIDETNSELSGTNISLSPTDSKKISATGDTTAAHAMNGGATFGAVKTAQSRLRKDKAMAMKGDREAAKRFQNRGGEEALNSFERMTKNREAVNRNVKYAAKERGENNAFQKPKTGPTLGPKGKAHTQKNNNGPVIHWDN